MLGNRKAPWDEQEKLRIKDQYVCRMEGIPMQRLREGHWETEGLLKGDGENHLELRILTQAEETGQVLSISNHIQYLWQVNRIEPIH